MFAFVQPSFSRIKVSSSLKCSLKLWLLISCLLVASRAASAATIVVPAGGDLQAAINSANFGDTIVLQAGASYTAPGQQVSYNLPLKSGGTGTAADYITITTCHRKVTYLNHISVCCTVSRSHRLNTSDVLT